MDYFNYRHGELFAEDIAVAELAKRWGTPLYVYSRATLERHWSVFNQAFADHPHQIFYAVKANSNIAVLNVLAVLGSGFDIVSIGELERVLAAGGDAKKIVFSGVGKLTEEIKRALDIGIFCFNVESAAELITLQAIAEQHGKNAEIAIRVNPDIDAQTHPYIATGLKENKFGVDINSALTLYEQAASMPYIKIKGIACHIGSQLTHLQPFIDAFDRIYGLAQDLKQLGITIEHIDMGGGLGVRYDNEQPPEPHEYAAALLDRLGNTNKQLKIMIEPGRAIAANAGILVTKVIYLKSNAEKNFAIVDAGMNDYIRPALYDADQMIIPVSTAVSTNREKIYDIVGPVCETGDFLGKNRRLKIAADDLLAIRGAGAYGFSMSSNYNSRPRAAEVMVDGNNAYLIRNRETIADLFKGENLLPIK